MNGGIIEVKNVTKGLWSFVETEAPAGYCADSTPSASMSIPPMAISSIPLWQKITRCLT